jgi:hypothetical protein
VENQIVISVTAASDVQIGRGRSLLIFELDSMHIYAYIDIGVPMRKGRGREEEK